MEKKKKNTNKYHPHHKTELQCRNCKRTHTLIHDIVYDTALHLDEKLIILQKVLKSAFKKEGE